MKLMNFQLLPFQQKAVDDTIEAINNYDDSKNLFTFGSQIPSILEGEPKPYLHRIKAITGAGKTPMLAAISSHLKNSIILWTTTRGAIIEQTTENLKGKYRNLLADDVEVFGLDEVLKNNAAWNRTIEKPAGCTIITTTVAAFNQKDGKNLIIHRGNPSPWQQLCEEIKRPIWVFYDEGHNATENQFNKLLELQPEGFILASASPLAADLQILLPGEDTKAKETILNEERTTVVDTKGVVAAGLLKRTIEIHDLDTGDDKILEAAYKKREYLEREVLNDDENIIACYIVDRDSDGMGIFHGLHIWERLIAAGADPGSIAVHLSGAEKAAKIKVAGGNPLFKKLDATYDRKFSPGELKKYGYKHIIWNLSLEEGWDEPWAYVGYFHREQANENKVVQRIGRLIRNPFKNAEGLPALPAQKPLRSVYCYLNTSDNVLKSVVERLRSEMDTIGLDVVVIKESSSDKNTLLVQPRSSQQIPKLILTFDPPNIFEKELYKALFDPVGIRKEDYKAHGKAVTLTMNVGSKEAINKKEKKLAENAPTTVGDVVKSRLAEKDSRLIRKRASSGGWINPLFWTRKELQEDLNYSSKAYYEFRRRCDEFIASLDKLIKIDLDNDQDDPFVVESIKLINPDGGNTEAKRKYYKVRDFKNSVHPQYNGLNDLEYDIAIALDQCGVVWARNPARTGYGIPLVQSDNSSTMFYPDFIVWKNNKIFFLETKGYHLVEETKKTKLTKLPNGLYLGIITQEHETYTLIQKGAQKIHPKTSTDVKELITEFIDI